MPSAPPSVSIEHARRCPRPETAAPPRRSNTRRVRAVRRAMRCPETNSMRSHRWEPSSAKAREEAPVGGRRSRRRRAARPAGRSSPGVSSIPSSPRGHARSRGAHRRGDSARRRGRRRPRRPRRPRRQAPRHVDAAREGRQADRRRAGGEGGERGIRRRHVDDLRGGCRGAAPRRRRGAPGRGSGREAAVRDVSTAMSTTAVVMLAILTRRRHLLLVARQK